MLEQQSKRRSRLKLAVFCVLAVGVAGLSAMLIQGCKREQPAEGPTIPRRRLTRTRRPSPTRTRRRLTRTRRSLPPVATNLPVAMRRRLKRPEHGIRRRQRRHAWENRQEKWRDGQGAGSGESRSRSDQAQDRPKTHDSRWRQRCAGGGCGCNRCECRWRSLHRQIRRHADQDRAFTRHDREGD